MKKQTNIYTACSKEAHRPELQNVYFENGFMIATNGYIIVKMDIKQYTEFRDEDIAILNGKAIHGELFKKTLSLKSISITEEGFIDNETGDVYRFNDIKPPDYNRIFQVKYSPIERIGIDPSICMDLMNILKRSGINSCAMNFQEIHKAIHVTGEDFECLLMPRMR